MTYKYSFDAFISITGNFFTYIL